MGKSIKIRHIQPSDYDPIINILNDWWGGRKMHEMLPKLFFVHFSQTSFIAEIDSQIIGFLIGFLSQTYPEEAYIHFAGVHPEYRILPHYKLGGVLVSDSIRPDTFSILNITI